MLSKTPLLEIDNLVVDFETPGGMFNAVRGISLCLEQGGSHAIIGESGSGKSVTASAIMSLIDSPPGHVRSGDIRFQGRSILSMPRAERRRLYGRHIAMVFQDPAAHLNPVYPVGWQIAEVCRIHGRPAGEAKRSAIALMERVGIGDAARRYHAFPHQFLRRAASADHDRDGHGPATGTPDRRRAYDGAGRYGSGPDPRN